MRERRSEAREVAPGICDQSPFSRVEGTCITASAPEQSVGTQRPF